MSCVAWVIIVGRAEVCLKKSEVPIICSPIIVAIEDSNTIIKPSPPFSTFLIEFPLYPLGADPRIKKKKKKKKGGGGGGGGGGGISSTKEGGGGGFETICIKIFSKRGVRTIWTPPWICPCSLPTLITASFSFFQMVIPIL